MSITNGMFLHLAPTLDLYIESMYNAKAYSATSEKSPLASTTIARRDPTEIDVQLPFAENATLHGHWRLRIFPLV